MIKRKTYYISGIGMWITCVDGQSNRKPHLTVLDGSKYIEDSGKGYLFEVYVKISWIITQTLQRVTIFTKNNDR